MNLLKLLLLEYITGLHAAAIVTRQHIGLKKKEILLRLQSHIV